MAERQGREAGERPLSRPTRSRLPPPRSPSTPSAPGVPLSNPTAASRASSAPLRTWTCRPHVFSTRARNAWPSLASRTADVPSASSRSTSMASASLTNRARLRSASETPVGAQFSGFRHAAGERALGLFVEDGNRQAGGRLVDHQTNGVGADIDDADTAFRRNGVAFGIERNADQRRFRLGRAGAMA